MAGRESSLRRRSTATYDSSDDEANVFADSHALNDVNIDRSPFLDESITPRRNSIASQISHHSIISVATHYADEPSRAPAMARRELRNSIRKSRSYFENPFNGHEESERTRYTGGPSMAAMVQSRMTSNDLYADSDVDDGEFADTQMTFAGGPSHDYGQFSQNTTSAALRSPTIASTLIAQPTDRSSLHGPAHPYNMYPQNVDEDMDDTSSQAESHHQPIMAGFPRNAPRFRSELDNISVSEQLPPYSEYPEDGAPKHIAVPPRIAAVAPSTSASSLHTVIHRAREPQSMADNPDDNSLLETATNHSSDIGLLSGHTKTWKQKSWREKRETKFCGIPFGWIMLVGGTFLFIAIVLSSVIGGFFTYQAKMRTKYTAATLYDAERLYNETSSPLAVGTYQLQFGTPQETQDQCITNSSESSAWSCQYSSSTDSGINIAFSGSSNNQQLAYVYQTQNAHKIGYGTMPPVTWSSALRLVKDMDLPSYGPAWQFQSIYTKTVVAYPDAFYPAFVDGNGMPAHPPSQQTRFSKRDWAPWTEVGDQPWFCYWNNTLLEGFIYVNESATAWYSNSTALKQLQQSHNDQHNHKRQTAVTTTTSAASPTSTTLAYFTDVIKIEERRIPGDTAAPVCHKMQILADGTASPLNAPDGTPYQVTIEETNPNMAAYTKVYGSSSSSGGPPKKRATVSGACHCQWMSGQA